MSSTNLHQELDHASRKDKNDNKSSCILHDAIRCQKSERYIIKMMDEYPEYLQQIDDQGNMPLHLACDYKCPERIILRLCELYPDALHHPNDEGNYPLHIACLRHLSDSLIMKIVDGNPMAAQYSNHDHNYPLHLAWTQSVPTVMKLIEVYPHAAQYANHDGNYPLHIACYRSNFYHVIMKLIDIYPDAVNRSNHKGNYPLHIACCNRYDHYNFRNQSIHASENHNTRIVIKLLELYPDIIHQRNCYGRTPLLVACYHRRYHNVEMLLQYCATYNNNSNDNDYDDLITMIINDMDEDGNTPLHSTIMYGTGAGPIDVICVQIIQYLLDVSSSIRIYQNNHDGYHPLDIVLHRMSHDDATTDKERQYLTNIITLFDTFMIKRRCHMYDYMSHEFVEQD